MAGTGASGGRNSKSTAQHVIQGTFRKDRHAGIETPEPPQGTPEPPKLLEGDAKAEWDAMAGRLADSGTLCTVDGAVLFQYAALFSETEAIKSDQIENRELVIELMDKIHDMDDDGDRVEAIKAVAALRQLVASATRELRQGRMALRQYLAELGQTPASRTRVRVRASEPKDKSAALLARYIRPVR